MYSKNEIWINKNLISRLLLNDAKIYENYRKIIWNMNDIEFEHFFNGKRNYPFNVPNKHTFLMLMNKIENYRFVLDWGYNERLYPYLDQLWNNYVCMENLKSHKEEDIKNFLESGNINYSSWPESIKNEFKKSIQHTINTIVYKCKKEYEQLKGLPRMLIDQINGFIKYLSNNIKFEKMKNVVEKLHLKLIKDFLFKSESSIGKYVYYSIAKDVITPVVEFLTPNSLSCIFDYVKNFMNSNITLYYFETYVTLTDIKSALDDYHKIKHIADKTEDYRYELNKIVKDFEEHITNFPVDNIYEVEDDAKIVLKKILLNIRSDFEKLEELIIKINYDIEVCKTQKKKSGIKIAEHALIAVGTGVAAVLTAGASVPVAIFHGLNAAGNIASGVIHIVNIVECSKIVDELKSILKEANAKKVYMNKKIDDIKNQLLLMEKQNIHMFPKYINY